ncbi:MAG: PEP-CTERM sorting domain-containing protein [Rhodospirillaceae bacterium]|nr:PEP-CTERM sorting domain-containing protein [Rhodospirillaceae bacterium]
MNVLQKFSAAAVLAIGFTGQAQAAIVTHIFTGTVTSAPSTFTTLGSVGDSIQYSLTFDTAVPPNFSCCNITQYFSAINTSFAVDGVILASTNGGGVNIYDHPSGSDIDRYTGYTLSPSNGFPQFPFTNAPIPGYKPRDVEVNFQDNTGNLWSSMAIPTSAPSFATVSYSYLFARFTQIDGNGNSILDEYGNETYAEIYGSLDTMQVIEGPLNNPDPPPSGVPAPAAMALFGLGLFGLGVMRRKMV